MSSRAATSSRPRLRSESSHRFLLPARRHRRRPVSCSGRPVRRPVPTFTAAAAPVRPAATDRHSRSCVHGRATRTTARTTERAQDRSSGRTEYVGVRTRDLGPHPSKCHFSEASVPTSAALQPRLRRLTAIPRTGRVGRTTKGSSWGSPCRTGTGRAWRARPTSRRASSDAHAVHTTQNDTGTDGSRRGSPRSTSSPSRCGWSAGWVAVAWRDQRARAGGRAAVRRHRGRRPRQPRLLRRLRAVPGPLPWHPVRRPGHARTGPRRRRRGRHRLAGGLRRRRARPGGRRGRRRLPRRHHRPLRLRRLAARLPAPGPLPQPRHARRHRATTRRRSSPSSTSTPRPASGPPAAVGGSDGTDDSPERRRPPRRIRADGRPDRGPPGWAATPTSSPPSGHTGATGVLVAVNRIPTGALHDLLQRRVGHRAAGPPLERPDRASPTPGCAARRSPTSRSWCSSRCATPRPSAPPSGRSTCSWPPRRSSSRLPVLLVCALLIKLDDGGPVLFRQTRVGRDGRTFRCLKLRTMAVDAEDRAARARRPQRAQRPAVQARGRPPGHPGRRLHAGDGARRAAPADQRAPGRDEHRRPPARRSPPRRRSSTPSCRSGTSSAPGSPACGRPRPTTRRRSTSTGASTSSTSRTGRSPSTWRSWPTPFPPSRIGRSAPCVDRHRPPRCRSARPRPWRSPTRADSQPARFRRPTPVSTTRCGVARTTPRDPADGDAVPTC